MFDVTKYQMQCNAIFFLRAYSVTAEIFRCSVNSVDRNGKYTVEKQEKKKTTYLIEITTSACLLFLMVIIMPLHY